MEIIPGIKRIRWNNFTLPQVYMFIIKFFILLIYGLLFDYEKAQTFVFAAFFFIVCKSYDARLCVTEVILLMSKN